MDDVVVVVEDGDGEFVAAQIFPDVFDRIEFGSVGWQTDKGDVFGDRERGSNMIAAPSRTRAAWLPVATLRPIAVRCSDMASASAAGMTRPLRRDVADRPRRTGRPNRSVGRAAPGPRSTLGPDAS